MKPFVKYDAKTGKVLATGFVNEDNLLTLADESRKVLIGIATAANYVDVETATVCKRKMCAIVLEKAVVEQGMSFTLKNLPVDGVLTIRAPDADPKTVAIVDPSMVVVAHTPGEWRFDAESVDTFMGMTVGKVIPASEGDSKQELT